MQKKKDVWQNVQQMTLALAAADLEMEFTRCDGVNAMNNTSKSCGYICIVSVCSQVRRLRTNVYNSAKYLHVFFQFACYSINCCLGGFFRLES